MFTISTKGSYGLSAVLGLGLEYGKGPIQIKTIADSYNIPQHYLEQILIKLKNSGIMISYRGANGGYSLAKAPSKITVYDVLKSLEGKQLLVNDPGKQLVLKQFWKRSQNQIEEIFNVTIEELILEHNKLEKQIIFEI